MSPLVVFFTQESIPAKLLLLHQHPVKPFKLLISLNLCNFISWTLLFLIYVGQMICFMWSLQLVQHLLMQQREQVDVEDGERGYCQLAGGIFASQLQLLE